METMEAERISDDELAWHRAVLARRQAAETVARAWSEHLAARYGLGRGDAVDEDGAIVRSVSVAPAADGGA